MGIKDEIFSEFYKKLEEDKEFPKAIIQSLKSLHDTNELNNSKKLEKILNEA